MPNETVTYYCFKEEVDGKLITPWNDPMEYEYAFDFTFLTPEGAREYFKGYFDEEDRPTDWVLVKETTTIEVV